MTILVGKQMVGLSIHDDAMRIRAEYEKKLIECCDGSFIYTSVAAVLLYNTGIAVIL